MTKTFKLVHDPIRHFYFIPENKSAALCEGFVKKWLNKFPSQFVLTVSTEPIENALRVYVVKNGFYRWYWSVYESRWNQTSGMSYLAEETLNRLFPDAKEDGDDPPKEIWLI